MDEGRKLLRIVKTWNTKKVAGYRGFKCGNCKRYLHKAWHYHLKTPRFNTPVHLCNKCQAKLDLTGGVYKSFTCGNCGKNTYKAFHVWGKKGKTLIETHYCKNCIQLNSAKVH